VLALPLLRCNSVLLPFIATSQLPLRLSPHFRSGLLYVPLSYEPLVSADGGRTFRSARRWGDEVFIIYDLAAVPSPSGQSAIVAQQSWMEDNPGALYPPQLARTDDGGRTWTSLWVDLPEFSWASRVIVTPTGRIIAANGSGYGGLGCSSDGGRTWARSCAPPATS
jgi:hypothetical protein